ncbi:MAG: DUF5698 domain-containing protein [Ignavibacteriae bacterium]|nr:DUF5698 domain-containing protein [Ignavibacteriota bacterium]
MDNNFTYFLLSALLIMCLRIFDVSLGTIRTLMTVQGRKYIAGCIGFFEVTIWILAIRYIMQNLDNLWNIIGYSTGFALGTILGVTIEQMLGSGFLQLYIFSMNYADAIADELRKNKIGVTLLPGEGGSGGVAILMVLIIRKRKKELIRIIDKIDPKAFISVQTATPYRGYIHSGK